jgi:hypothetical protein
VLSPFHPIDHDPRRGPSPPTWSWTAPTHISLVRVRYTAIPTRFLYKYHHYSRLLEGCEPTSPSTSAQNTTPEYGSTLLHPAPVAGSQPPAHPEPFDASCPGTDPGVGVSYYGMTASLAPSSTQLFVVVQFGIVATLKEAAAAAGGPA